MDYELAIIIHLKFLVGSHSINTMKRENYIYINIHKHVFGVEFQCVFVK